MCFFYDHISGTLETIPWKDDKDMRIDKNVKISIQTIQGSHLEKSLRYGD